jgi:hypothetical protein
MYRRSTEKSLLNPEEQVIDSINDEGEEAAVEAYSCEQEKAPRSRGIAEPPVVTTSG